MEYFLQTTRDGESFKVSTERLFWNVTKLIKYFSINGESIDISQNGVWNPNLDSLLGLCYTFSPKTFQNGIIPLKYRATIGQIHNAQILMILNVRY